MNNPLPIEQTLPIATIVRLSHDGRGIAIINGKTTFIWGALVNEQVQFRYQKRRSTYDEAIATEIIVASPQRQKPRCPHFGVCGGCSLQHFSADAQIDHKQKVVLELLKHQAGISPIQVLPPIRGQAFGYRRKARVSIKYLAKKNKMVVGFHERQGVFIADCNACFILDTKMQNFFSSLRDLFYQLDQREHIPQLEIAISDDDDYRCAIILRHLQPLSENDLTKLHQFCFDKNLRLYLQSGGLNTIYLDFPKNIDPLLHYHLPDQQLKFQFHPYQFIQVNAAINQQMINQAIEWLEIGPRDIILDLFCGIGNFSLPMALKAFQVFGVEGELSAVKQAKNNAVFNKIINCEFFVDHLSMPKQPSSWLNRTYHKLLLDPPRCGAKEILDYLPMWNPSHIVYVSCNPITFARDAQHIAKHYQLQQLRIMDMFPQTQHIEVIAQFVKKL